ncbi:MAG: hypothetical protein ACKVJX_14035 [Verrucomicrobiia bacterium]|jgi:hypothetical protein
MNPSWKIKTALCVLAALLAGKNLFSLRGLTEKRAEYGLTHLERPLENAPPLLAFSTVALGGFRGLIANYLWIRANSLQQEGRYFETLTLARWITQLQPRLSEVWIYQAWNMSYNVTREFDDPHERYMWIDSGIRLLRDEGIRYNPQEPTLYRELAWFYEDKFGQTLDDEHRYYKQRLAAEMRQLFGRAPDYDVLLDPQTDAARETVRRMKEEYNLDPQTMKDVDEQYGPFDWRLPEAHSVYWAAVGLKECKGQDNLMILRRTIWQSMHAAFKHGRLIENQIDKTLDFGPNLELLDKTHLAFEEMMRQEAEELDGNHVEMVAYVGRAHQGFLTDAVYYLYLHNRLPEALKWFATLKELYPGSVPEGSDLITFALARATDKIEDGNRDQVVAVIEGALTSFYMNAGIGEGDALGLANQARAIHKKYDNRVFGQERLLLPDFDKMREDVLDAILAGKNTRFSIELRIVLASMFSKEFKLTAEEAAAIVAREEAERQEAKRREIEGR